MHCCTLWLLLYSLLQIIIHFIFTFPIEKLCINYWKWQLLYTQLKLTIFVIIFKNDNFCIHCYIGQPQSSTFSSIALQYYKCWFILILLHSTTCVCIITVVNFCMHHFKWQIMYALLYLTTFLCTIAIKFERIVAIEESNIKTIRNIDYNNMNNLITTI